MPGTPPPPPFGDGSPSPPPPPFGAGPPPPPPPFAGDAAAGASYPPGYGGAGYGPPGYGVPGYGPPGYGPPGFVPAGRTNGMAVASLVLGIIAMPLCFIGLPALLAVVFGIVGIRQCNRDRNDTGRGLAIAGLVLGSLSILLTVVAVIWLNSLDPSTWEFTE